MRDNLGRRLAHRAYARACLGGAVAWGSVTGTLANQTDLQAALDAKQAAGSYAAAAHGHVIGDVTGLQAALDGKQAAGSYQPLASVLTNTTASFTTAQQTKLSGIATAATANSSDATLLARANHTGTQAQSTITNLVSDLALKAPLASPAFTGTVTGITAAMVGLGNVTNVAQTSVTGLTGTQSVAAFKTGLSLVKGDVGLGNVDNTADTAKPVSTAQQTALDLKANLASPSFSGAVYFQQAAPVARNATTTLTIADLLTLLISSTSATAVSLTLPTGTLTDAGILGGALANDRAFDWAHINLGSSSGAVTFLAGTNHTVVGNMVVPIGASARFRTRKTATNTFVTYRIG